MSVNAPLWRDANHNPIQVGGVVGRKSLTLSGNNTTVTAPIFTLTGTVNVVALYGVVTTDLGANNTAAYWRLNDQTAQPAITLSTGTTLSAVKAGSVIVKKGLAAAALVLLDNSAGRVSEPTTLETTYFSPFVATKKTAATTQIEFVYSTTDTPTSGVIQFFAVWLPVSADAALVAV
jgi:hypothetical protein